MVATKPISIISHGHNALQKTNFTPKTDLTFSENGMLNSFLPHIHCDNEHIGHTKPRRTIII
jgi:hypothetical protein